MILLVAALSLAMAEPPREDLAQCLAHLSNAPEYARLGDAEIARSDRFFVDAMNSYCSDEVSADLWDLAHQRARLSLGLAAEGQMAAGQQEAAKREMASILQGTWSLARTYRAHPRPLSTERMERMVAARLLDDRNKAALEKIMAQPIDCLAKGAAQGKATVGNAGFRPSRSLARACGYDRAVHDVAGLIRKGFPGAQPDFISRTAGRFVRQAIVWAVM